MLMYILFIIGFVLLIKGADILVDGASAVARRFNISDLVIGLTVVAFGTSTPELFVNILSSLSGNTEISIGNILGSIISNIFLILGISAMIYPLKVPRGTVWREIPFSFLAALVLGIMANDRWIDGSDASFLTRIDGMVLLCFFLIFAYYSMSISNAINGMDEYTSHKDFSLSRSLVMVFAGLVGLSVGGKWIVDGAVSMATKFGMSESLVGLTIVAIGTSLPELATSAVAAYKRNVEIAVGNVVGSNIFNIFLVLGISSTIKPLPFMPHSNFDIGVVIFASLLLFIFMFTGKKRVVDRWEGAVAVLAYFAYVTYLIIRG